MTDAKTFTGPEGWKFTPRHDRACGPHVVIAGPGVDAEYGLWIPLTDLHAFLADAGMLRDPAEDTGFPPGTRIVKLPARPAPVPQGGVPRCGICKDTGMRPKVGGGEHVPCDCGAWGRK